MVRAWSIGCSLRRDLASAGRSIGSDVVRYAETEGFKLDRWRPHAHRYRDYVIRAFNDDLPYDRFVRQQRPATSWSRITPMP